MTFTGLIGRICMFPLRLIIDICVKLRIHPNTLTFIGVLINFAAASALALGKFVTAGVIMIVANIFDFIDGKVASESNAVSAFGAFWDSVIDRFSDISLFIGLIFLYSRHERTDYVMDDLIKLGEVRRATIPGIQIQQLTTQVAQQLGASNARGALVYSVDPRADAARSGLARGDIIVSFNGSTVDDTYQFIRFLSDAPIGSTVTLGVLRQGRQETVKVVVTQASSRTSRRRM